MNSVDKIATAFVSGVLLVAALTTIFGRKTSGPVVDSLGKAFSNSISASLGKGVTL